MQNESWPLTHPFTLKVLFSRRTLYNLDSQSGDRTHPPQWSEVATVAPQTVGRIKKAGLAWKLDRVSEWLQKQSGIPWDTRANTDTGNSTLRRQLTDLSGSLCDIPPRFAMSYRSFAGSWRFWVSRWRQWPSGYYCLSYSHWTHRNTWAPHRSELGLPNSVSSMLGIG